MNLDLSIFFCIYSISLSFLCNLHAHKHKHKSHFQPTATCLNFCCTVLTPGILFASLYSFMPLFALFLHMSVKYPESTHTRSLPRTPRLAYGASELGEIVGRRCLCRLDLNWPVLNSELQRMACGNKREEVKPQQYVAPIVP